MGISDRKDDILGHSTIAPKYWETFRKQVFTLVGMGYERLQKSEFQGTEEPAITGELARKMAEIVDDFNSPSWTRRLSVHDHPPVNVANRRGKHRLVLDLSVKRTGRGPHPHYVFEAKRLSTGNMGVGAYLGEEGLGMYMAGLYGRDAHEAGMLGYVQCGSVTDWAKKIMRKVSQPQYRLTGNGAWAYVSVIANLETYRTCHERPEVGKSITIFHLFLIFQ